MTLSRTPCSQVYCLFMTGMWWTCYKAIWWYSCTSNHATPSRALYCLAVLSNLKMTTILFKSQMGWSARAVTTVAFLSRISLATNVGWSHLRMILWSNITKLTATIMTLFFSRLQTDAFSALTLLVVSRKDMPIKKLSGGVLAWLYLWGEVQIRIWPSWYHCHSLSLATGNPDWFCFWLSGTGWLG